MKRCPACDFIYEDDEGVCEMDGTGLVNYSGPLSFEESGLPQSDPPRKSHGRSLTLVTAGVILAIAVFLYFHNVANRNAFQSNLPRTAKTYDPSQPADQKPDIAIPVKTSTPVPSKLPSFSPTRAKTKATANIYNDRQSDHDPFRGVPSVSATPLVRPSPSFTPARATTSVTSDRYVSSTAKRNETSSESGTHTTAAKQAKTPDANQKNESRITSLVRKTGRILKRPFRH